MRLHATAVKSLRLGREAGFGLLVSLTIILGWVMALGAGTTVLLSHVYHEWALERQEEMRLYLPAEADAARVKTLEDELAVLQGIGHVRIVPPAEVASALAPYVTDPANLPLPTVIALNVRQDADRGALVRLVHQHFAMAEVDESRLLLSSVARIVRGTQVLVLSVAVAMVAVMAILMALTVRASLRSHKQALRLLVQLGALDQTVVRMVLNHVGARLVGGWLVASGLSAAMLGASMVMWPALAASITPWVWVAVVVSPLFLVGTALLVAALATRRMLEQHYG